MADFSRFARGLKHWRGILLLTVGMAVPATGFALWIPHHREQQVVQRIESRKGCVETESGCPTWLRRLAGDDCLRESKVFDRVVAVHLERTVIGDGDIACLSGLTHLRNLTLDGTGVTDAGLAHLCVKKLEGLSLCDTQVDDTGLKNLSGLSKLTILYLSRTQITDAGLAHLARLTKLREIAVDGTAVTANGVADFKRKLPECHVIR